MSTFDAVHPEQISRIDSALGRYFSRLGMNADDLAHVGEQLNALASAKNLDGKLFERSLFLRSCAYKLAEEGLILTGLIIACIVHRSKTETPEAMKILNPLADLIHETFDPELHKILSENASCRHVT